MFSKTKIALCVALVLGTASAALAGNDIDESVSEAQAAREMGGNPLPWWWNSPIQGRGGFAQAASSFAYVAPARRPDNLPRHKGHTR